MKVDDAAYGRWVKAPDRRVILLHGDDPVLVAGRAGQVAAAVSPRGGMFGPAEFDGPEHAKAVEALLMPSLGGGCVVRLRDATDTATPSLEVALRAGGDGFLVVEAGVLLARSRLRALAEGHAGAASVWCRGGQPKQIAAALDAALQADRVSMDAAARSAFLEGRSSFGEAAADAALLVLLVGTGGTIGLAEVRALGRGVEDAQLDELAEYVSLGDRPRAEAALEASLADGAAPVAVIRSLLLQFARLRQVKVEMESGRGASEAMAALRPPVFSSRSRAMMTAIGRWSASSLDRACAALWRADHLCRQTGAPVATLCRDIVRRLLAP